VPVRKLLWELANEIKQHNLIEIIYQKKINSSLEVKRCIQPVAILFSDYYFYLNGYIVEQDELGTYNRKYNYPAIFRIDRIQRCRRLGEKFKIPYASRFEEGEFRKRVQFMYAGELVKLQFRYSGNSLEAILDRLPTARVLREDIDGCVIEAEVFGKGVLMWLMSQGNMVEILKPESYRSEMKELLEQMLKKYS
jgi:predicted DNA-binding transcriptional regulator YafY